MVIPLGIRGHAELIMASFRKRTWRSPSGDPRTAWVVDYQDASGKRRNKQFDRKKDADAWLVGASWEVRQGIHTPDSQSITILEAGKLWLDRRRADDLEPTTLAAYDQHIRLHIKPLCGGLKLSQVTRPMAENLRDRLVAKVSKPMAIRVLRTLTSIVSDAQSRGRVAQNVFQGVRVQRGKRDKAPITIPTKTELRAILRATTDHENRMAAALVTLLMFSGLRASELRGLLWRHIDLRKKTVSVKQRADNANVIGPPKSESSYRTIPLPDLAIGKLKEWKLSCPLTDLGLVFPSDRKGVMSHRVMTQNLLHPVQVAADVSVVTDDESAAGRYTLHDFRHAAASLWIDQGVSAKRVQRWMGHGSIQVTFDTYGHLFDSPTRDAAVVAEVEQDLTRDDDDAAWMLQAS